MVRQKGMRSSPALSTRSQENLGRTCIAHPSHIRAYTQFARFPLPCTCSCSYMFRYLYLISSRFQVHFLSSHVIPFKCHWTYEEHSRPTAHDKKNVESGRIEAYAQFTPLCNRILRLERNRSVFPSRVR